jgi:hypothetical protein
VTAKEKKVEKGEEVAAKDKKKRRQGTGEQQNPIEYKLLALIPEATKPLLEGWFVGMPPSSFKFEPLPQMQGTTWPRGHSA